ncbi:dual serine/threonine and tyrosine protein kinase-like [Dendronephthya gigantea]|uniref:dual serine/threonine and tyrosine protein kinase-like n=1 Tax=Dendronephthya gigantea TaxID=151771 RepID=UPI00106C64DE|nr:dual serine/threonine and tyrosine protein kinase-like [Dendronephthya gigantea]
MKTKRDSIQRIRAKIKSKMPEKSIDDVDDVMEMAEIFKLLKIDYDRRKLNLEKMKKQAKEVLEEQSSGSGKYLKGTTGFGVIANAKEDDNLKRKKLKQMYFDVATCLQDLDEDALVIMNSYYSGGGVFASLSEQIGRLGKRDYNLLIAGESSAGKSSLLNLILGEELLPHHVLCTTSAICELKFGKERKLVTHYKYDDNWQQRPPPRTLYLKTKEECGESYQEQIAPFVYLEQTEREKGSSCEKVEIFWPHELLEEGIVIIDTPGLGESDVMDNVLMNYLPNAFAFIYVIDVSHAGGVQRDIKGKLMEILERLRKFEGHNETFNRLAECSLFVCNKWDQVQETQKAEVKKYVSDKLSDFWQNENLYHQIVCISTTQAIKVQQYGGVTTEFNHLLESIERMILRTINTRLYNHWKWLDLALRYINRVASTFNQKIIFTSQTNRQRMDSIERRMKKIAGHEQSLQEDIKARIAQKTKYLDYKLEEYIYSPEFQQTFCDWSKCSYPHIENSWAKTKSNIVKAVQYRFEELMLEWERKNQVYSDIHREIVDEFLARLNVIKEELECAEKDLYETKLHDENNKSKLFTPARLFVGAISPLWVPVGVAGFIIGIPVFGAFAIQYKVSQKLKLGEYIENPRAYLERRSNKFLKSVKEDGVLKYAEEQMANTATLMRKYTSAIPKLLEADRKMVSKLLSERRSKEKLTEQYTPIIQRSMELREYIIPALGIELYPATVDECHLEWKKDEDSCLGEGKFSTVYSGKLRNGGIDRERDPNNDLEVAVKVFKKPFDNLNSRFYLYEEVTIRYLKHENVVNVFGTAQVNISHYVNDYTFIFVMELCKENLRSFIQKDERKTPAESSTINQAIQTFLKWAKEIARGLNYIHEIGLVHRHLKLENILVDEQGTAKISDIGILGQLSETEVSMPYLAPEVLEDLTNRTKQADIYSYGIMLWEMWYGTQAFKELMPIDKVTFKEKIAGNYRPKVDHTTINIPAIHDVMKKCWKTEIKERYSAKECYEIFQELVEKRVSKLLS